MSEVDMEIQLKLDSEGRTIFDTTEDNGKVKQQSEDATIPKRNIDYNSKTVPTAIADMGDDFMDDILFDAEIADCALLPRTFWMAENAKPRCKLEQFALDVFDHHVPKGVSYDSSSSGAEWWVQIRPSPPTGRYTMLVHNNTSQTKSKTTATTDLGKNINTSKDDEEEMEKNGIHFHWDKDEDLRLLMGGNMYIHPHISTVTYLTNIGPPTVAVSYRVNPLTGEWLDQTSNKENTNEHENNKNKDVKAFLSWPKRGKHLSFDGRFLHAAPSNLLEKNVFHQQIQFQETSDKAKNKILQRRHRRVTFLVNIWLNFKPVNVNKFPDTMIDKLSKFDNIGQNEEQHKVQKRNLFAKSGNSDGRVNICKDLLFTDDGFPSSHENCRTFTWDLGGCDCNERIKMRLPMKAVCKERENGGNVSILWKSEIESKMGVKLCRGDKECRLDTNDREKKRQRSENIKK